MATTIDRISGGRFGLNLVMGWFTPELAMFTASSASRTTATPSARSGSTYVLQLWSEEGSFEHDGTYFDGSNLESYPKPVQAPRPVLINAGNSPSGVDFSARNVDINFASLDTLENMKDYTTTIKDKARTEYDARLSHDDLRRWWSSATPRRRPRRPSSRSSTWRLRRGGERHQDRAASGSAGRSRAARAVPGALRRRLGRLPAGRHARAGRRGAGPAQRGRHGRHDHGASSTTTRS